jgi:hypothetical protein
VPGVTDVVNVALQLVGGSPITSLGDGTPNANVADDIYTEIRDDLLRSHPWNFATKRVKLAQSATTPAFEFDFAYPLPSDWLRTISVHSNDAGHGTILFRMEIIGTQRAIVASSDEVYLRYIYQVTDPNQMSADFRRALELSLARDLAVKVASSNSLQAALAQQAERKLASARSSDAMGGFPELRPRGSWATRRGGGQRNEFLSD